MHAEISPNKVVYCIDEFGIREEAGQWLKVSIASVLANTRMRPVVVYSGENADDCSNVFGENVEVLSKRSRLKDEIERSSRQLPIHTEGAMLRYEIPSIFTGDEFILYADCDTYFFRDFTTSPFDETLAASPTSTNDDGTHHFNSGIIIFNVRKYLNKEAEFFDFLRCTLGAWLPSSVDEKAFNQFWKGDIGSLPKALNWRPKWGYNTDISVLHVHGFKASAVSLLEGDSRGFHKHTIQTYIYELALEYSLSIENMGRYFDLMDRAGNLDGSSLKEIADRCKNATSPTYLIGSLYGRIAELAGGTEAALILARNVSCESKVEFALPLEASPILYWRIHLCSKFGVGRIHITGKNLLSFAVHRNSSVAIEEKEISADSIVLLWAGIGLDCHLVLMQRENEPGECGYIESICIFQAVQSPCVLIGQDSGGAPFSISPQYL